MSGDLYLGLQPTGGDLYLYPVGVGTGLLTGTAVFVGAPIYNGRVFGATALWFEGRAIASRDADFEGESVVVGQGLATTGTGTITGTAVLFADNTILLGTIVGSAVFEGEGRSRSRFAPFDVWPGYSSDGTTITIPLADLFGQLTAEEADTVTGDWREITQALTLSAGVYYDTLSYSNRSKTFEFYNLSNYNARSARFGRCIQRKLVTKFNTIFTTNDVISEE